MESLADNSAVMAPASEFEHWWYSQGQWVEPANQRRGGESGVQLLASPDSVLPALYCKRQQGHIYRSLRYPFGRPTILRESHAYRAITRLGIITPNLIYSGIRRHQGQWQALLVTEALQGFVSLEDWYAEPKPPALTKLMLNEVASTLARLHAARWQHGCCYPKHIFIRVVEKDNHEPKVEVALLDLEKCRRRLHSKTATRRDLGQLARHRGAMPEVDMMLIRDAYQRAR